MLSHVMKTLITPDVKVKPAKPSREQKAQNKLKLATALFQDNEIRLRVTLEIYDSKLQRYSPLQGETVNVWCRSKEAVAVVVSGVGEAVEVLDQLRLGK
jgi:hypothetical protein